MPVRQGFKVVAWDGIEPPSPCQRIHNQCVTDMLGAYVTSVNVGKHQEVLAKLSALEGWQSRGEVAELGGLDHGVGLRSLVPPAKCGRRLHEELTGNPDAGSATVTLPDAGQGFMSMQVIDQDEYTPMVLYTPGPHTLTRQQIGTRYVLLACARSSTPRILRTLRK
jgi:hypothetical protein